MATVPEATVQPGDVLRYNRVAVWLHWLTALIIVIQVRIGFLFAGMPRGPERGEVFTWHKTLGVVILLLALTRLAWRLTHKPPPFPVELPRWERVAAVWNHRVFYALIIALPLTGLAAVSGGADRALTDLVGGLAFPVIPGVSEATGELAGGVHEVLVFTTLGLLVLHIGAALKHQFVQPNRAAGRMPPFREPKGAPIEQTSD